MNIQTGFSIWGSEQKQKVWAKDVLVEGRLKSSIKQFIGTGTNVIIQEKSDLQKKKGDRIYFDLFLQMDTSPVTGNSELSGNEDKIISYTDDVLIDRTRKAFVKYGRLEDIYSEKDLLAIGKSLLSDWYATLLDEYAIRWLEGDTSLTWPESVPALASTRIYFGGDASGSALPGTGSDDIGANDWLGTYEISRLKYLATQADPKFRPLVYKGNEMYIMFIHPRQAFTLKQDSTWQQAQREAMPRGMDNPMFTGALGYWDQVVLFEDEHLLTGASDTEARAILCGAQAGLIANGGGPYATYEKTDHENRHSVGLDVIWGIKRAIFNSVDYAVLAIDTYATAPAGQAHS